MPSESAIESGSGRAEQDAPRCDDAPGTAALTPPRPIRPQLDEHPQWFVDQFEAGQRERTRHAVATRVRAIKALRHCALLGAGATGIGVFATACWPWWAVLILVVSGAALGALLVRLDSSRLGAAIVFCAPLLALTLGLTLSGIVTLTPLAWARLLFVWFLWSAAGSFISMANDRLRGEVLPY